MGYLLGEYEQRHRITAEVCEATGLSEEAVQRLLNLKIDAAGHRAEKSFNMVPRLEILSRILSDPEFWQILYNLSQWTSPEIVDWMSAYNAANAYAPASEGSAAETQPLSTPLQDTEIASAAMHFFNVAKRAVGWATEMPEK